MKIADQNAKRTPSIKLKPIQLVSSDTQREHRINVCRNQESLLSSPSSSTFLSPPTTLSFLSNCHSTFVTPQPNPVQRADKTLEERARRILGPYITIRENDPPIPTLQAPNFEKDKKQLDNMKSCLKTIEMSQQAADHLCQLHKREINCREALNFFLKRTQQLCI
ncbi:unnamed protein product [Rotaria sordida]|uniref:Uncharacterized protein n=1 Tax=Rotaria sordida TaxID=392033 RepID=A0A819LVB3_9BILA|nr:unnamed protein product [Rotaria sordida]